MKHIKDINLNEGKYIDPVKDSFIDANSAFDKILLDKNIPKELKKELKLLKDKFSAYDTKFKNGPLKKTTGNILTLKEVKGIIRDATGFVWNSANMSPKINYRDPEYRDPAWWARMWDVRVDKKDIAAYEFDRNTDDRNELSYLEIACIPGYVYMRYSTDKVDDETDKLISNSELGSFLEQYV